MSKLSRVGSTLSKVRQRVSDLRNRHGGMGNIDVDLYETAEEFVAVADTPGAQEGDVQVRYLEDRILVRVERFREHREGFEVVVPGRPLTTYGEIELPNDAQIAARTAAATLRKNGTLMIELPKAEALDSVDTQQSVRE